MKETLKYFIVSKVTLLILLMISILFIPDVPVSYTGVSGWLNPFTAYDGEHYMHIAKFGYDEERLFAFFPLYPLLMALIKHVFFISYAQSGFFISLLLHFLSGYYLQKIVAEEKRKLVLFFFFFSPISAFFVSVYTESLFVFLGILFFYLIKEKKYRLSLFIAILCCLTRNVGFFIMLIFFVEIWKEYRFKCTLFFPFMSLGLLYPIYLWVVRNDPFYFSHVQFLWGREPMNIFSALIRDVKIILDASPLILPISFNFAGLFLSIILSIRSYKKHLWWTLFLLFGTIMPLTMPATVDGLASTTSLIRYVFGLFPIYIFLAELNYNKKMLLLIKTLLLFLFAFISLLYFSKVFIA